MCAYLRLHLTKNNVSMSVSHVFFVLYLPQTVLLPSEPFVATVRFISKADKLLPVAGEGPQWSPMLFDKPHQTG